MSDLRFDYATLTHDGSWRAEGPQAALRKHVHPAIRASGASLYAAFAPQFGLASDQMVVITTGPIGDALERVPGVAELRSHATAATARPKSAEPPRRPGVYVHRFFDLAPEHVEESVQLSAVAWETFERTFEVEIIGFFRTLRPDDAPAELMLLNWYPTLAAWEASREFDRDPESKRRFLRRAALSERTRAITTLLLEP